LPGGQQQQEQRKMTSQVSDGELYFWDP
jgi:hypothetical protein